MKYNISSDIIPQEARKALNDKIIYLIDSNTAVKNGITHEDVFNAYTGEGGLHGLSRKDFDSYSEFSTAKKEIENGQFFTKHELCKFIMQCLNVQPNDMMADLTCGIGNFFNYAPNESNVFGCEIDVKSYKVAQYLYPKANIENKDVRTYAPSIQVDYVAGNPPFNLKWSLDGAEMLSQLYYCMKAAELLKPLGIMALVVPKSFLADTFTDGGMIERMEEKFSFLGQFDLPANAFSASGVNGFETKVQFWQKRRSSEMEMREEVWAYQTSSSFGMLQFNTVDVQQVQEVILKTANHLREINKNSVFLELSRNRNTSHEFEYAVKKMLYQIRINPKTNDAYSRCVSYVTKFYTQKASPSMSMKEWDKVKVTEKKVLAYLRQALNLQNKKPQVDVVKVIKNNYGLAYKGYSVKAKRQIPEHLSSEIPFYQLMQSPDSWGSYSQFDRLLKKRHQKYMNQSQRYEDMQEDMHIANWLSQFTVWDEENEEWIVLNEKQKRDLNMCLQKQYNLLQWEQGSGKTLAGIATGLYLMEEKNILNTWVASTAISIKNNWDEVLPNYGLSHVLVTRLADLKKIKKGDFVLITLEMLSKYQKQINKFIKISNQRVHFVFDESDEMSNPNSIRAKAALTCFRHCRSKLLMTGTSTRNNISEFCPQLELLYNNSVNMLSKCRYIYHYPRTKAEETEGSPASEETNLRKYGNPYYCEPIPAYRRGYLLFTASHLPEKITVFGVGQRTQDIYNAEVLREILDKTVITRSFEEVCGKDIKNIQQVPVTFSPYEKALYAQAINEFHAMRNNYFASSGSSRKDSMMALIQQIVLLLRISAAPNTLQEYESKEVPIKIKKVVQMVASWPNEMVAIGVRHKNVVDAYAKAIKEAMPDRPLFVVTGATTTLAKRKALRKTLKASQNGILLCTQQSLPSSVNFEYVNKVIIPELHYNNSRMSQFYFRFIRYTSTERKDIYFVTYAGSIESNQMQMVLAKEKINLFMKGQNTNLDEIYQKFGVDYDLMSCLMTREEDEDGTFTIRWGEQMIS